MLRQLPQMTLCPAAALAALMAWQKGHWIRMLGAGPRLPSRAASNRLARSSSAPALPGWPSRMDADRPPGGRNAAAWRCFSARSRARVASSSRISKSRLRAFANASSTLGPVARLTGALGGGMSPGRAAKSRSARPPRPRKSARGRPACQRDSSQTASMSSRSRLAPTPRARRAGVLGLASTATLLAFATPRNSSGFVSQPLPS
mmetsp:Transcript_98155/g.316560  ORF Transcript_98155/g.316560 Transcript_98155/m.316560 type:complete len:204 (-) Transcript_98155:711-1322(-)